MNTPEESKSATVNRLEAAVLTSMQTLRLFQYDDNGHLISWPSETWWRATITDVEAALSQIQEPLPSEKTPLETAARMLRQALILIETEDDYMKGGALTSLSDPLPSDG